MQLYSADINILRDTNLEPNPLNGNAEEASILLEYYSRNGFATSNGSSTTATFASISVGAAAGPDGTMTAFSLIEDTTAGVFHVCRLNWLNTTDGTLNTGSVYIKAGSRTGCWVDGWFPGAADPCTINLLTGAIVQSPVTAIVRVTDAGNGWWRIDRTAIANAATHEEGFNFGPTDATFQINYNGNGTGNILCWTVCDFMNRSVPSSDIISLGNQAGSPPPAGFPDPGEILFGTGRWSDSPLQIPFTAVPQEMSGLIEFIEKGTSLTSGAGIWSIGDYVLASPSLQIGTGASGYQIVHNNGGNVSSALAAFPTIGQLVRLRWTLRGDGSVQIWQSINGAAEVAAASSAASSLAVAWSEAYSWLNGLGAGNQGFIAYRQSVVLPGADISLIDLLSHFT